MVIIENRCCGCDSGLYPCMGEACHLRRYEAHYCDRCGLETTTLLQENGKDLCEDCMEISKELQAVTRYYKE